MFEGFLEGLRSLVLGQASLGKERRQVVRLRCYYGVMCHDGRNRAHAARVTEMSLIGLRLEGSHRFARGEPIQVTLPEAAKAMKSLRGTVVWSRRRPAGVACTGLVYDDRADNLEDTWVKAVLRELGFEEPGLFQKRQYVRFETSLGGEVRDAHGGRCAPVTVLNLGVGGALLRASGPLAGPVGCLHIGPHAGLPAVDLPGTVVGRGPDPEAEGERIHFRFVDPDDRSVRRLGRYLIYLLREGSL